MSSRSDVPLDAAPGSAGPNRSPPAEDELALAHERIRALERELAIEHQKLRAAETTLEVVSKYHDDVLSAVSDVLLVVDSNKCILTTNRAASKLLGYEPHQFVGMGLDVLAPELEPRRMATFTRQGPGTPHIDTIMRSQADQRIPVLMRVSTLEDSLGGEVYVVAATDMRERLRFEQELGHAQRLESVGQLSAGIAHEINNPLSYVIGNLEYLIEELDGSEFARAPDVAKALEQANEGALRVRDVVRDLLSFSRADRNELEPVDVHVVLESTVRLAMGQIKRKARVVRDYGNVPAVLANRSRLGQVALNLVINAVHALPDNRLEHNVIRLSTGQDERGRVVFEVRDNGPGVPEHVRDRLFEPFFSTKPTGQGTGLGLSICQNIITRFRGEISLFTEPGQGAAFRVHLPPVASDGERGPTDTEATLAAFLDEPLE